ncbi:hypothetical protein [Pseudomonas fluorescens]|nr:hypothetical protein [Pseudomonas fluorescens]
MPPASQGYLVGVHAGLEHVTDLIEDVHRAPGIAFQSPAPELPDDLTP